MQFARTVLGTLVGIGLIAGSVATAQAQPGGWGNGGYGNGGYRDDWDHDRRRRHHGDGFNFGDAVGIAALIGAVAVVASSVSKDRAAKRASNPDYAEPPIASSPSVDRHYPGGPGANTVPLASEDSAVDACAVAARDEATRGGGYAEIRRIGAPQPTNGGYNIDGEVERRGSYRDEAGETRRFTCSVQDDRVTDVYLSRDLVSN